MAATQQSKVRIELERLFRTVDSDGSGTVSSTEFDASSKILIQVLGATSQSARAPATTILKEMTATSFDSIDLNHDQTIDFAEFETWIEEEDLDDTSARASIRTSVFGNPPEAK